VVHRILLEIEILLDDTAALRSKYGLKPLDQDTAPSYSRYRTSIYAGFQSRLKSLHSEIYAKLGHPQLTMKDIWVVGDDRKFSILVDRIRQLNDSLCDLTRDVRDNQNAAIDGCFSQMNDSGELSMIQDASAKTNPDWSEGATRRLLSIQTLAPKEAQVQSNKVAESFCNPRAAPPVPRDCQSPSKTIVDVDAEPLDAADYVVVESETSERDTRIKRLEKHLFAEKHLTAVLEEAIVDLEKQGKQVEKDLDMFKKRCGQLEDQIAETEGNENAHHAAHRHKMEEELLGQRLQRILLEDEIGVLKGKNKKTKSECEMRTCQLEQDLLAEKQLSAKLEDRCNGVRENMETYRQRCWDMEDQNGTPSCWATADGWD